MIKHMFINYPYPVNIDMYRQRERDRQRALAWYNIIEYKEYNMCTMRKNITM